MIYVSHATVYGRYHLLNVYGDITSELTEKIIALWKNNGILPAGADPYRRVNEVAVVILDSAQNIVGVSTVYPDFRPRLNETVFLYRMFIQPQDRTPSMMLSVLQQTYALLNALRRADKPTALMIETENPKLMREGMRRQFEKMGYQLLGKNPQGQDVWRKGFYSG